MFPWHLKYTLNRRQRLLPHLVIWGPYGPVAIAASVLLLVLSFRASHWFLAGLAPALWMLRGFVAGMVDVLSHPTRQMDILIDARGIGYMRAGERWWIFLDGLLKVDKICPDVWTLFHRNGTVINIPVPAITDEQISFLQSKIKSTGDRHTQTMDH